VVILVRDDLAEHDWILELSAKVDAVPGSTNVLGSGLVLTSICEDVVTGLSNEPRDSLSGVGTIEVRPFLDLDIERVGLDVHDSNGTWVLAIVG